MLRNQFGAECWMVWAAHAVNKNNSCLDIICHKKSEKLNSRKIFFCNQLGIWKVIWWSLNEICRTNISVHFSFVWIFFDFCVTFYCDDIALRRGSLVIRASFERSWRGFKSWPRHKVVGKIVAKILSICWRKRRHEREDWGNTQMPKLIGSHSFFPLKPKLTTVQAPL